MTIGVGIRRNFRSVIMYRFKLFGQMPWGQMVFAQGRFTNVRLRMHKQHHGYGHNI